MLFQREIQTIIADLYQTFERYRLRPPLEVCRCPACVSPESERALLSTPLKDLSPGLLGEFTNSALVPGRESEMKYFLPRYFELLFAGEQTSPLAVELSLDRLGKFEWSEWPSVEKEKIGNALRWWVKANLAELSPRWTLEEVLVCVARGGLAPAPLLKELLSETPVFLDKLAELSLRIKKDHMANEFWPEDRADSRAVRLLLSELDVDTNALIEG